MLLRQLFSLLTGGLSPLPLPRSMGQHRKKTKNAAKSSDVAEKEILYFFKIIRQHRLNSNDQ